MVCNELKVTATKYEEERYVVELCGTNKASILNYEYLMFQSFVDPFSFHVNLYLEKGRYPVLRGKLFKKCRNFQISEFLLIRYSQIWPLN